MLTPFWSILAALNRGAVHSFNMFSISVSRMMDWASEGVGKVVSKMVIIVNILHNANLFFDDFIGDEGRWCFMSFLLCLCCICSTLYSLILGLLQSFNFIFAGGASDDRYF